MTWWTRNDEEWPDWTDSEDELKEQEEELAAEEKNAEKDELNGEVGESGQDLAYLGEDEISEFSNLNFHQLEVVSRYRDPQLQVGENV